MEGDQVGAAFVPLCFFDQHKNGITYNCLLEAVRHGVVGWLGLLNGVVEFSLSSQQFGNDLRIDRPKLE